MRPRAPRWARLRLRRFDGAVYLDRWGIEHDRIGGVFLHRMEAPDPGLDLHDHPWWFVSFLVAGGYTEERAQTREASFLATLAERWPGLARGIVEERRQFSVRVMRLDECHRITALSRPRVWTVVVHGPTVRRWGFYLPTGYLDERTYDQQVRAGRRDLWNEATS